MINYIIKTEDYDYIIWCSYKYIRVGTEFEYNGRKCRVISNCGKL